ncbi:TatD family hydrolase [Oceanobacillus salinisoli]|uniref:TatD family hydrolase n=1 Tax=Oceanobacillus salinisoli TaxID=2678611 RepID=UPI0012E2EB99|nr:TatD family hydrolase [Oceanobacillus salinisoli]
MYKSVIDAHIHLDLYKRDEQRVILNEMEKYQVEMLISVSNNLASAVENLSLSRENNRVRTAIGFHREQPLPSGKELESIILFIDQHHEEMIAVGEVGLPYYRRKKNPQIPQEPYIELLEWFIITAKKYQKPIALHAVYEDASIVCTLLEKHSIDKAHFHWFKGDLKTMERIIQNGWFISLTPDILYETEIQNLGKKYPLNQLMVETDGPWSFKGPFKNEMTHPKMIHESIAEIAKIKNLSIHDVYDQIYQNTVHFYSLK